MLFSGVDNGDVVIWNLVGLLFDGASAVRLGGAQLFLGGRGNSRGKTAMPSFFYSATDETW